MTESEDLTSSDSSDPDHSTEWTSGPDDVDLAASALLDGESSADELDGLDPGEVRARLDTFARVAEQLRLPVVDLPETDINRLITTALTALDETAAVADGQQAVVAPLRGRHTRAGRHPWRWERLAGAAAAVVLVVGLLTMAALLSTGSDTSSVASSARTNGPEAATVGARDQNATSTTAAAGGADLRSGFSSATPVDPKSGVAAALGGGSTDTRDLPSLGVFADQEQLLASLAASLPIPQPPAQAASTTSGAASSASAAPSAPLGGNQSPHDASCSLRGGIRALGTALVGGHLLIVGRDDTSGHIVAFDTTSCALVFDRMP
ncbi:MAG: hypothetical protein QOJ19_4222 [Acidimicrobiia bacterium]|jgi:hypothetical protein|nr:hypothetical protein [Acidimicrobiia bacterium]